MKDGNVAIMNTGYASGENRITKAIENALNSPLLNTNDVSGASKVLLSLYCSSTDQIKMEEVEQIHEFMLKVGENVQVIWGASFDDELKESVKITLIATGFDVSNIPGMPSSVAKEHKNVHNVESAKVIVAPVVVEPEIPVVPEEIKKIEIDKAMGQYYGKPVQVEPEPELPIYTLDDLENETTLKEVENIPAWKRKLMR